jgi:hypothetical protein
MNHETKIQWSGTFFLAATQLDYKNFSCIPLATLMLARVTMQIQQSEIFFLCCNPLETTMLAQVMMQTE